MTWIFTIDPEIPGLLITTDGDNKATLHGHPLYPFSGVVTVTANNGTVSIDSVLNLELVPIDKVSVAAIENQSQITSSVTFEFTNLEVSIVDNHFLFEAVSLYSSTLSQNTQFSSD